MKLRLKLQGGAYGTLELEEIDTEAPEIDVPEELLGVLDEERTKEAAGAEPAFSFGAGRTERQTYELEVREDDGTSRTLRYPESALDEDPRLKELVDAIWKQAKPVPQTDAQ